MLTSERDLQARTTAEDLAGDVNAIEKAVDIFFTSPELRTSRELTIQLSFTTEGHEVQVLAKPGLTADVAQDLHKGLEGVPAPSVGAPVKLEFIVSVWSVASKQ